MRRFWNRLKYRLLHWLLDDICDKSNCRTCDMDQPCEGKFFYPCAENYVFTQARKAWGIGARDL